MKIISILLVSILLAGCATKPVTTIQYVDRPVRVKCLGDDPKPPIKRTEKIRGEAIKDEAAASAFVKAMGADLVESWAYSDQLKAQMAGCR